MKKQTFIYTRVYSSSMKPIITVQDQVDEWVREVKAWRKRKV